MLSDLDIQLDDSFLSDYFDLIEEPDRGLFPTITQNMVDNKNRNGERLTSEAFGSRTITLSLYAINGNFRKTKDSLAGTLFSKGMHKLWFSDEPDRYWSVRLTGESRFNRQINSVNEAYGELNFIVPDGISHAMETRKFDFTDDEAIVSNNGTYETPLDVHVKFVSDTNSIGIVSEDDVVQLGTAYSEDAENFIPSNKVVSDPMNSSQKSSWKENVAKPRWRNDSSDNASQIMGTLDWNDKEDGVFVKSWGTIDPTNPGFWHGPSVTRFFTEALDNLEISHRFNFKPINGKKGKKGAEGLLEINYLDADSNFIFGFEMKDNTDTKEEITYRFFVGNTPVYAGKLPNKIATNAGGFFGSIAVSKVGNKFVFKLARLQGSPLKETWSATKTFYNETVAMLSANRVDCWMSQWKNFTAMNLAITDTRITKINTEDDALVPKTFYAGDELFVDGTSNRVYINGIRDDNYRVIGSSQFLEAPVGTSEYTVLTDGEYTGYLEMREKFL